MKRILIVVSIFISFTLCSCDTLLQTATGIATSAGAGWMAQQYGNMGYSDEDTRASISFLADGLGLNSANVDRGIRYVNAADDNIKKNIVSDEVYDLAGKLTGQEDLVNTFKQVTTTELKYKSDMAHATTDEEKQAALNKKIQNYADISYDAYQTKKERNAKYLAEQSKVANELKAKGYSSQEALDIASSLIAVENADYMSDEEKQEYYDFFFSDESVSSARATVQNVAFGNYSEETSVNQLSSTNNTAIAGNIAQDKAKTERDNAVNTIKSAKINAYKINSTELSDEQKATLDKIAVALNQYSDLKVEIKGHTCDLGSDEVNNRIGLRRAENAKAYLTGKGISNGRISTISAGEKEPIVDNTSDDNRKQNRRLTFTIK